MTGAWFALVPAVLSTSSWMVVTLAGPIFLVAASVFWDAHRPAPSFLQSRTQSEAAEAVGQERR
jgi:hypothetical protein